MEQEKIKSVVILGGQCTGWTVAAVLSQGLQAQGVNITVIHSPDDEADGEAESTLPNSVAFQKQHGMNEADLMRATRATFKLGTRYENWWGEHHRHFQPLSHYGAGIGSLKFHNYYTKARQQGSTASLDEYSLCATAASGGRFIHPVSDQEDIRSTLFYGLHMDTAWYHKYLQGFAQYHGARTLDARVVKVNLRDSDGFIDKLELDNGQSISADLFIDCSGPCGELIGESMGISWDDWSDCLPVNRSLTINLPPQPEPDPFTTLQALEQAWMRDIPLQDRVVREFYFNDEFLGEQQALEKIREISPTAGHLAPRSRSFSNGRRTKSWTKNCIAMGHSACSLEPLALGRLHFAENQALRLMDLFPGSDCDPIVAHEFNRLSDQEFEQVRDFALLHYLTRHKSNESFWNLAGSQAVSKRISDAMALFESRGELPYYDGDTFGAAQWAGLLYGSGRHPNAYNRHLDTLDWGLLQQRFETFRATVQDALVHMPTHREYLLEFLRPD